MPLTPRSGCPPPSRVQPDPSPSSAPPLLTPRPPPWQDEAVLRDRVRFREPMHPASRRAEPKPKRNLLFSSTSREERERAEARSGERCRRTCRRRTFVQAARLPPVEAPNAAGRSRMPGRRAERAKPDATSRAAGAACRDAARTLADSQCADRREPRISRR